MQSKIFLYQSLFHRSFFFDKYAVQNVFTCPRITRLVVRWPLHLVKFTRSQLIRVFFLFYLTTGQKPQVFTKSYNLRGFKKTKLIGFGAHLDVTSPFVEKLLRQHIAALSFPMPFSVDTQLGCMLSLHHKTQDDDVLAQAIKVFEPFNYRVWLSMKALSPSHVKTLVLSLKIPCD